MTLDEQCARALGWKLTDRGFYTKPPRHHLETYHSPKTFKPSSDPTLTPLLLAEIARRGTGTVYDYIYQLVSILEPRLAINKDMVVVSTGMAWLILTATPEQHARAFVKVTEGI